MPNPGEKTSEEFDCVFTPISNMLVINKDAMRTHWLELGCLKKHDNKMDFQWKGHVVIMIKELD